MFFRQRTNDDASISYYLGCAGRGRSILVDVLAGDEEWHLEQSRRSGAPVAFNIGGR